ncbi:uncharacterized protein [Lolium perenne]|uniref:uncharacterized protein isoform X2 n=1 Tax=Lolium perenne TaxID=4522 RepID=UPI0021F56E11|nr:uncharacterized protein LOC127298983 [Lolium perenne]
MDLDDDDFEMPSSTSPHFGAINTSKKRHDDHLVNHTGTDKRPVKKRKTPNKNAQNKDAKFKQNVGFKCSPHLLFDLVKSLDSDQRKWVDELGFGIVLSMPNCRLPKDLTVWLVNHFSWKKQALTVRGQAVPIKPLLNKLLGIPDGPFPVPLPRSKRGKSKCIYPTDEEKEMKEEKGARGLSYKSSYESLIANRDPVQFKRSFMLYVLCIYFAPSSGHFINMGYSPIVSNVDIIKDMNWCDHVADVLIEGIHDYRDSKAVNVNVHGCVHVLLLIYIDMVKSPILEVPRGNPRVIHVTTELLDLLDLSDLKFSSFDGPEYGKLELADSPYGEDFVSSATANGRPTKSIPGCTSTPPTHVDVHKVFYDEMQQIEAQYSLSIVKMHAEMYETYKDNMKQLDTERTCAIYALHKKVSSLDVDAAATPHPANSLRTTLTVAPEPLVRNSIADPSSHGASKEDSTTITAEAPISSTPSGDTCFLKKASHPPVELSQIPQPANNISYERSEHPYVHNSIPLQKLSVEATLVCTRSPDASERSEDLQKNCRQLSTILVNSTRAATILNLGSSARNRRLFPEVEAVCPQVSPIHNIVEDDPLGFDIMKEVSEIGKQVSQQALKDTDAIMSSPLKACHIGHTVIADSTAAAEIVHPSVLTEPIHEGQIPPPLFGNHVTAPRGSTEASKPISPVEVSDEYPVDTRSVDASLRGPVMNADITCTPQLPVVNDCSGIPDFQLVQSCREDSGIQINEGTTFGTVDAISITSKSARISSQDLPVQEPEPNPAVHFVQSSNPICPHTISSGNLCNEDTAIHSVHNPSDQLSVLHNLQHGPCGLQQVLDVVDSPSTSDSNFIALHKASTNAVVEDPKHMPSRELAPEKLHNNESVSIEELALNPDSLALGTVHTIGSPISDGEFFEGAGSVNTAVRARGKRFGKTEHMIDAIAELKKTSCKANACASQTYADHVEKSIFWATERKDISDPARNCCGKTKILIRGVHVSEEEFVQTLKPTGHVDPNFMCLCCEALMLDWHSKSRIILNQGIIKELMKPHDRCDHDNIASKLKLLPLDQIDQIYLPVPNNKHWILVLITISRTMVEIYDSLRTYKRGDDPYDDLWKTIGYNLQIAFSQASSHPVPIHDKFGKHYNQIQEQSNMHDSGLEVIRMLVCHNGKDLIGYGKKNMLAYRKELSHTLVYHRYNDLNPRRHVPSGKEVL